MAETADADLAAMSTAELLAELARFPHIYQEKKQTRLRLIDACRGAGMPWRVIAGHLGMNSPQAAQQYYQRLARDVGMDRVRELENESVRLICDIHQQWWRPVRNRQRKREARALLAECDTLLDAIPPLTPSQRKREAARYGFIAPS